jgi:hypothetical protein
MARREQEQHNELERSVDVIVLSMFCVLAGLMFLKIIS